MSNAARCATCLHQDRSSYAVPICAHPKAQRPNACVLAWERCLGRPWEAQQ